jgi:hypothetical protein
MSAASPPVDLFGNDNTFVAASTPRHTRLSKRIAALSVSTIASSAVGVESVAAAAAIARRMTNPASLLLLQRLDLTITSIFNAGNARRAAGFFNRLRLFPPAFCRRVVVGLDNARDEFVADDVGGREVDMGNPFDAFQQLYRFVKA